MKLKYEINYKGLEDYLKALSYKLTLKQTGISQKMQNL